MIIGADYSITSPSLCIYKDGNYDIYWRNPKETDPVSRSTTSYGNADGTWLRIHAVPDLRMPGFKRYNQLADWFEECMVKHFPLVSGNLKPLIAFEGVSYGSPGRVVQLAENAGVTKALLTRKYFVDIVDLAPSTVKKFATGYGFATKTQMHEAFAKEQLPILSFGDPEKSPLSDIVDSYWLCRYAINNKDALIQSLDPDVAKANKKKKRKRKKAKPIDS